MEALRPSRLILPRRSKILSSTIPRLTLLLHLDTDPAPRRAGMAAHFQSLNWLPKKRECIRT